MMALCFFLSLLIGAGWIGFVIRLDIHRREKNSHTVLILFFLAGFLSLIPTFALYSCSDAVWGGLLQRREPSFFVEELLIVGPVEELAKVLPFVLLSRALESIKEPVDGLLQGAMVALAFATAENLFYSQEGDLWVILLRAVLSTTGHLVYASFWGYVYSAVVYKSAGKPLRSEYTAILVAVLSAAIMHGLYNLMLDIRLFTAAVLVNLFALIVSVTIYQNLRVRSPYNTMRRQKPHQALAGLNAALRYNPENPLLNQRLALLYVYYRNFAKARKHIQVCRKKRPQSPYFLCVEAVVRILNGELERGATLMEEAFPRLSDQEHSALFTNVQRVVCGGKTKLRVPDRFGPRHAESRRFFKKIGVLVERTPTPTYRCLHLSRRRYLARVD